MRLIFTVDEDNEVIITDNDFTTSFVRVQEQDGLKTIMVSIGDEEPDEEAEE